MKETYYAVQIGTPKQHCPYFMLRPGTDAPALFVRKGEAEEARPIGSFARVVKVTVSTAKSK